MFKYDGTSLYLHTLAKSGQLDIKVSMTENQDSTLYKPEVLSSHDKNHQQVVSSISCHGQEKI